MKSSSNIPRSRNRSKLKTAPYALLESSLLIKEWNGHSNRVCEISRMDKPEGFITVSVDRHVKLWARDGALWGDIATHGEDPVVVWKFPYDWAEELGKAEAQVVSIMKSIEPDAVYSGVKFRSTKEGKEEEEVNRTKGRVIFRRSLIKPISECPISSNPAQNYNIPVTLLNNA